MRPCPACGSPNPAAYQFCAACGATLPPAPPTAGPPPVAPIVPPDLPPGGGGFNPKFANLGWFGQAWGVLSSDWGGWIGFFFVLVLVSLVLNGLVLAPGIWMEMQQQQSSSSSSNPFASIASPAFGLQQALGLVSTALQGILYAGAASAVLRRMRFGDPLDIAQALRDGFSMAMPAGIYAVLIGGILNQIAYCCCILPGIWFTAPLLLGYFRLVDGAPDFWSAFADGWTVARNDIGGYFLLAIASGLIYLLGILCCCIGVFITLPLVFVTWAIAYRASFE